MTARRLSRHIAWCVGAACFLPGLTLAAAAQTAVADAGTATTTSRQISAMQAQIDALQKQLDALRARQAGVAGSAQSAPAPATTLATVDETTKTTKTTKTKPKPKPEAEDKSDEGIKFGGAVRFQYSYEDYDRGNVHRTGDADFDIFRLNMRGKVDDVELQAEWRWFQYMSAIKFAWLAYDFSATSQIQVGITRIPFGNQDFDSHSYFFSSNYYLGLEDTYHAGVEYVYAGDPWNVQLAFFKNDAQGGVGTGDQRMNSYSYNVVGVRDPDEGTYANPENPAGSENTLAARVEYTATLAADLKLKFGGSALHGNLRSPTADIGHYDAYALHMNAFYKRLNVQAQAARYEYDVDGGADRLAVGAYAFYDTIPAKADTYTFNVKYHQPVSWGPIHGLDFYNDYSLVTNKSGLLPSTFMNVLGVAMAAGDLYTYFDFVTGRNQPFIGGSMAGNGKVNHRFNVNFGFYF